MSLWSELDIERLSYDPLSEGIVVIDGMLDEDVFQQAITRWKELILDAFGVPRTLLWLPNKEDGNETTV